MTENTNHFRARVQIILRDRGWSFNELARRLGKSPPRINDIVRRGDPKTSVLKEFAEILGVTLEEILEEVTPDEYGEAFMPTFEDAEEVAD